MVETKRGQLEFHALTPVDQVLQMLETTEKFEDADSRPWTSARTARELGDVFKLSTNTVSSIIIATRRERIIIPPPGSEQTSNNQVWCYDGRRLKLLTYLIYDGQSSRTGKGRFGQFGAIDKIPWADVVKEIRTRLPVEIQPLLNSEPSNDRNSS